MSSPEFTRAIGIETEYSLAVDHVGGITHELVGICHGDTRMDALFGLEPGFPPLEKRNMPDIYDALRTLGIKFHDEFLANGGRLYIDISGPEYCTPEVLSAEEAVHRVFAGDRLVYDTLMALQDLERIVGFQLNRKLVDHTGRFARGVHTNITVGHDFEQTLSLGSTSRALISAAIGKGAVFGSGGLLVDPSTGETRFCHSPRLAVTDMIESSNSHKCRPLIRHQLIKEYEVSRFHFVTDDAVNFPWPMRAAIVFNTVVLKLIEAGQASKFLPIFEPVAAAKRTGLDGHEAVINSYCNDKDITISPLDIIENIVEIALAQNGQRIVLTQEEKEVLEEIHDTQSQLRTEPEKMATRVESVARKAAILRRMENLGVTIDSERICRFDYFWDKIGPNGLASTLREQKGLGWDGFHEPFSPKKSKQYMKLPPHNTRAKVRGMIIDSLRPNEIGHINWDTVKINGREHYLALEQTEL